MQIQDSFPHSQRFGAIYWEFRRPQVPVQGNDRPVLKWSCFCPNLQGISRASLKKLKLISHDCNHPKANSFLLSPLLRMDYSILSMERQLNLTFSSQSLVLGTLFSNKSQSSPPVPSQKSLKHPQKSHNLASVTAFSLVFQTIEVLLWDR